MVAEIATLDASRDRHYLRTRKRIQEYLIRVSAFRRGPGSPRVDMQLIVFGEHSSALRSAAALYPIVYIEPLMRRKAVSSRARIHWRARCSWRARDSGDCAAT
jgi:hypothetical protein